LRTGSRAYDMSPIFAGLAGMDTGTVAIVVVAILLLAVLVCVLIMRAGVAPWVEWGAFKLGFKRIGGPSDESTEDD
jgi:hypothetical protein